MKKFLKKLKELLCPKEKKPKKAIIKTKKTKKITKTKKKK